ncbi:MAG: methylated-DNA--[protein]-cysteine S-methyltransferase [Ignavibacteriaceae bacterium]
MYSLSLPDKNTMYRALLNKDSRFEGIFFVGVKTTGIFCRPTCTARKPKEKNVDFFSTAKEALQFGYRPCKICTPLQLNGEVPGWLKEILKQVDEKKILKFSNVELKERNIDPARIRRWFKKHHGLTFQSYLRLLRVNKAFGQIKYGDKVAESAFNTGYDSLSGFTEAFKKSTGFAPSKSTNANVISITRILTPLGPMLAGATEHGICLLEFVDRRMIETQIKRLQKLFAARLVPGRSKYFDEINSQLKEYFEGQRQVFTVPLVLNGTEFQQNVWNQLQKIPFGKTKSYQEQAIALGNPGAVRAVAKANGDNRIAIIIPCHRVIGKNGALVGYGGGMWRKQYLLDLERKFLNSGI